MNENRLLNLVLAPVFTVLLLAFLCFGVTFIGGTLTKVQHEIQRVTSTFPR